MRIIEYVMRRPPSADPAGDLANDICEDVTFPDIDSNKALIAYLRSQDAIPEALQVAAELFDEYLSIKDFNEIAKLPLNPRGQLPDVEISWAYFPYCLERQDGGYWRILNRHYRELAPSDEKLYLRLTRDEAERLSCNPLPSAYNAIHLYKVGESDPHISEKHLRLYLDRLAILIRLGGVVR